MRRRHRMRLLGLAGVVIALGLLVAGCSSTHVVREGGAQQQARTSTPRPGQTVTVKRGDTLYRLAVNNGISPLDLATWNNIAPPYTIYPGQKLRLYPSGRSGASSSRISSTPSSTTPAQQIGRAHV